MAKKQLYMSFRKAELGEWLCKPVEQDMFELARTELAKSEGNDRARLMAGVGEWVARWEGKVQPRIAPLHFVHHANGLGDFE